MVYQIFKFGVVITFSIYSGLSIAVEYTSENFLTLLQPLRPLGKLYLNKPTGQAVLLLSGDMVFLFAFRNSAGVYIVILHIFSILMLLLSAFANRVGFVWHHVLQSTNQR